MGWRLPLRATAALLAALTKPVNGLGLLVTIRMAAETTADLGKSCQARTRLER